MLEQLTTEVTFREQQSKELATKLALVKQQINETDSVLGKKFACVLIGRIKDTACTIEFVVIEDKMPFEYYLFVDSKSQEVSINCENIESFTADSKGKLSLAYWVQATDWTGAKVEGQMSRKVDSYECAEG